MIPYVVLAAAIACLWIVQGRQLMSRRLFIGTSFFLMFLFLALRGPSVGEDTRMYLSMAYVARDMPWDDLANISADIIWLPDEHGYGPKVDVGYLLLNKIIMLAFNNPQAVLVFCSAVICVGFARFIYKNELNVGQATWVFLCGGLYMFAFNGMRQMLAIAIAIQSYEHMRRGEWLRAILWVFGGWFFHTSALLFAGVLAIYWLLRGKKSFILGVIVCCAVPAIMPLLEPIVRIVSPQYASYLQANIWEASVNGVMAVWIFLLVSIVFVCVRGNREQNTRFILLMAFLYLSLMVSSLFYSMFERIALYAQVFVPLFFCIAQRTVEEHCANALQHANDSCLARAIANLRYIYPACLNVLLFLLYLSYAGTNVRWWFAFM